MKRELNSKKHVSNNEEQWWYAITYPKRRTKKDTFVFNLWNEHRTNLLRQIVIDLSKNDWLKRIHKATNYYSVHGVERCMVSITKKMEENNYVIKFGRKSDGQYTIK